MQKLVLNKEPDYSQKKSTFEFQIKAENFIKNKDYCGIFYEQGLGKTKIALDISLDWFIQKEVDTVIVVTKKSLIQNWINEVNEHTFLKPRILTQNSTANFYVFNSPVRLILCHYEIFPNEIERLKLFCKTRTVAIILDEAAKIKNPNATITKSLFEISELFSKRIIMTGTPVANRPFDIWSLIYFLDKGKSLGTDFNKFKENTDLSNDLSLNDEKRIKFETEISGIFERIESFCIRETKEGSGINLPKKKYIKVECDWEYSQRDMYDQIINDTRLVIKKDGFLKFDDSKNLVKRILRLIQVTSNPYLIDSNYTNEPGKFSSLHVLVNQISNKGDKMIIWTNFIENVDLIAELLKEYKPLKIHGQISIDRRNETIKIFKTKDDRRILIATPASAKEGLTLTVANHSIYVDRNLSLDDYLQSQDRIHRISQIKECYIYDLIMKDSIDEWIDSLIESKNLAAKLLQNDIEISDFKDKVSYEYSAILNKILRVGNNNE